MNEPRVPLNPDALKLEPNGLVNYPPVEKWDDWVEYDTAAVAAQGRKALPDHSDDLLQLRSGVRSGRGGRKGHQSDSPLRRQSRTSRQPRPQLRQGAGDAQSSDRSRAHSLSAKARRQARRRQVGASLVGTKCSTTSPDACARRSRKSGATRSCITSAGPAMSCSIISGFFTPGASTATTATPTFAPPARARVTPSGPASIGRRRIMPTRALFCC